MSLFKKKAKKEEPKKTEKKPVAKKAAKVEKKSASKPATKKAAPKKVAAKKAPVEHEATRVYHVAKRAKDGMWQVKFAGGEKAIKLFKTQKEAIEYSKKMTGNQDGALLIHNSKGANKGKIKSK